MRRLLPIILTQGILAKHHRLHTCPRRVPTLLSAMTTSSMAASSSTTTSPQLKSLADWSFGEPKLAQLPLDSNGKSIRSSVPRAVFSLASPTQWKSPPVVVSFSKDVLVHMLEMDPKEVETQNFADWVGGQTILEGSQPMAHRYGGHQFGHWAGQLGDGRAHLLGEFTNSMGQRWELQLKGSGRTPYSRFGDGRAVLRSSVREFLCSEAMAALKVPTSRAASLVVVKDKVARDMFYDGRMKMEPCAVVLRIAPTWFRFGSFEILAKSNELEELRQLADFVLKQSFPHISETGDQGYLAMFQEVVEKTAELVAHWTSVGFAHGVLNTDNMSIASVTIDYGPFGFLDEYKPGFSPNHSDDDGRYDFQSQAGIGRWNLAKLATALRLLLGAGQQNTLETLLKGYWPAYEAKLMELWRAKLGLITEEEGDKALVELLLATMEVVEADFTQTFRDLAEVSMEDLEEQKIPSSAWGLTQCMKQKQMKEVLRQYVARLKKEEREDVARMEAMQGANPRYILRNWIAQRAIELAEEEDFSEVRFLLQLLQNPFSISKEAEAKGYASPPPKWSRKLAVSCSS